MGHAMISVSSPGDHQPVATINPESLVIKQGYAEPSLKAAEAGKSSSSNVKVTSALTAVTARRKNRYLTVP
jgi:hypothetical protein